MDRSTRPFTYPVRIIIFIVDASLDKIGIKSFIASLKYKAA